MRFAPFAGGLAVGFLVGLRVGVRVGIGVEVRVGVDVYVGRGVFVPVAVAVKVDDDEGVGSGVGVDMAAGADTTVERAMKASTLEKCPGQASQVAATRKTTKIIAINEPISIHKVVELVRRLRRARFCARVACGGG